MSADTPALPVIWHDDALLVLDKPAGVSVLADRSGAASVWDLLTDQGLRPLSVHRIDKGTSGVLLVALDKAMQRTLSAAFEQMRVGKWYWARITPALPHARTLHMDLPLVAGRKGSQRVAGSRDAIREQRDARGWRIDLPAPDRFADRHGRDASTRARRVGRGPEPTLVCVAPGTGRTHQIRVHLAWSGHPLLGDDRYGQPHAPAQQAQRLALHCHRLVLPEVGDRPRVFRAPLPADFPRAPVR